MENGADSEYGANFRLDPGDDLAFASLSIIALQARSPFLESIVTYAIADAITGMSRDLGAFNWVMRRNEFDGEDTRKAIEGRIDYLSGLPGELAVQAAGILQAAVAQLPGVGSQLNQFWNGAGRVVSVDGTGLVSLSPDQPVISDINVLRSIANLAGDPRIQIDKRLHSIVRRTTKNILDEPQFKVSHLGEIIRVFARWNPGGISKLLTRHWKHFAGVDSGRTLYPDYEPADLFLASKPNEARRILREVIPMIADKAGAGLAKSHELSNLAIAAVAVLPERQQFEFIEKIGPLFQFSREIAGLLAPVNKAVAHSVLAKISQTDVPSLSSWLSFLSLAIQGSQDLGEEIHGLARHDDDNVRLAAIGLLRSAGTEDARRQFVSGKWSYKPAMSASEALTGSALLAEHGRDLSIEEIESRILPDLLPIAVEYRGLKPDEIRFVFDRYMAIFEAEANNDGGRITTTPHPFPMGVIFAALVKLEGGALLKSFASVLEVRPNFGFFGTFPIADLLEAGLRETPVLAGEIWKLVKRGNDEKSYSDADFNSLVFMDVSGDVLMAERVDALLSAKNDQELFDAVYAALGYGNQDWLIEFITTLLRENTSGRVALGLSLAGFLNNDVKSEMLWKHMIAPMLLVGWLSECREDARMNYQSNVNAQHWFRVFLAENRGTLALDARKLFEACIDRRFYLWGRHEIEAMGGAIRKGRLAYLDATTHSRSAKIKRVDDERKKTLYATNIETSIHPWR